MIDPSPIGDTDKTQPIVQRTYSPRAQNDQNVQNVQNIQKHKTQRLNFSHKESELLFQRTLRKSCKVQLILNWIFEAILNFKQSASKCVAAETGPDHLHGCAWLAPQLQPIIVSSGKPAGFNPAHNECFFILLLRIWISDATEHD